ncbi:uncharacterized protein LOC119614879 [Lucilia sericata]|uniref:uncharacterized protein LOC119614879 n=1 Tax=Lucilia sericata TaxID=13632 RepID=UPI0018A87BB3|nr:uncharacterized protein LOC119614879 [Lucilia sericata]
MSKATSTFIEDEESWGELNIDDDALQSLLDNPLEESNTSRLRDGEQHVGFDNNMGESWIYPNNLPCRSYQMSIVQAALYRNTLVVLPTGLGKTFIAAVVMYNIYRWYPRGKIIFMAPTRPLVNQQIEACQKIMPFPKKDTIELTGKLQRDKRAEMWKTKRVFFATPQVVQSDIFGGRPQAGESLDEFSFQDGQQVNKTEFPFDLVKLIVIDEAHKAKGKYAYTEVAQALARNNKYFRVLALSATPGRTLDDVAEVCRNLFISHIEVRWDTSLDVLPYIHKRSMDTVVVAMDDRIKEIRKELLLIVDPYLRQLTEAEVLSGSLTNINRNFLLYEQKRFRDRSFHLGRHPQHSAITSNFAICISLYHALELLERHGLRVFLNNFEEDEEGKAKFVLQMDRRLGRLVERLKQQMGPNPFEFSAAPMTNGKIAEIPKDLDFGHPKFEKTRECLLRHFENSEDSRAIVFCEYRESVMLIYRMILQHVPLLKPRCFVGQGGTSGSLRALTQKQQIQIMNDFREGKSNILIATSIGEEGIDVGEVELIVCFDISTSNPTRFVQRIGRTGRKKNGHVIMMVTEGREQQLLREVLSNKDQINKRILRSTVVQQSLYKHAPRLVPTEFKPKCIQTFVKPPVEDEEPSPSPKGKKSLNSKAKTPEKGNQDLRKFFQKKPKPMDKEDMEFFEMDTNMTQAKPGLQTQQRIVNKLDKMKNLFKDLQSPIATQTQKVVQKTPTKVNNSQGSIKEFFKNPTAKSKANDSLSQSLNESDLNVSTIDLCEEEYMETTPTKMNSSQGSIKDFFKTPKEKVEATGSVKQTLKESVDSFKNTNETTNVSVINNEPGKRNIDPERLQYLENFLSTTWTTPEVLKRAEINDLTYHLKSKELSREMKTIFLMKSPEYIKENLEQMKVLKALYENDTSSYTEEEKNIREINNIILELFGGLEKVEKFLKDLNSNKFKEKCWDVGSDSEEEDPEEMDKFQKHLDNIFEGLGDGKRHDNYDWIQQRLKETRYYKELNKKQEPENKVQESMVYDTLVETEEEESSLNNFEDYSITESKYCSQWQEFSKTDIAYKSTPLQGSFTRPAKRGEALRKTSLLSKLEETQEEYEMQEEQGDKPNTSANTKQVQTALEKLAEKLKEHSLTEAQTSKVNPQQEFEKTFKTKVIDYEKRKQEMEIKENLLKEDKSKPLDNLDELENMFATKRQDYEKRKMELITAQKEFEKTLKTNENLKQINEVKAEKTTAQDKRQHNEKHTPPTEENLNSTSQFDDFHLPDEEELIMAATEAELKFTQTQQKDNKKDCSTISQDLDKTPDISNLTNDKTDNLNNTAKLTPPSLNSTPELDLSHTDIRKSTKPSLTSTLPTPPELSLQEQLDIDMEAFMDPFPEEQELIKTTQPSVRRESFKENITTSSIVRESPDLFAEEHLQNSPIKRPIAAKKPTLAAKLSSKLNLQKCQSSLNPSTSFNSPQKPVFSTQNAKQLLKSPSTRLPTDKQKYEKSPSIFDMYMKSTKGKGKLPKALANNSMLSSFSNATNNVSKTLKDSPQLPASQRDESIIVVRSRSGKASKMKIFDSDSEQEGERGLDESSFIQHRKKRRRFNSFIEHEAGVSGSEQSEDEADHTIGCYIHDSVVVASDDEDPDQASTSHMQAMYLQSLKSPQQRRGAFKIPAPRVYNDRSRIFSQAVLPDDTYSQYLPDSFVVEEEDSFINDNADVAEVSMCPLEKAEKILKERRRAKKLGLLEEDCVQKKKTKSKKKIQIITDSSDDDFE